jgi:hypothetical protein
VSKRAGESEVTVDDVSWYTDDGAACDQPANHKTPVRVHVGLVEDERLVEDDRADEEDEQEGRTDVTPADAPEQTRGEAQHCVYVTGESIHSCSNTRLVQ